MATPTAALRDPAYLAGLGRLARLERELAAERAVRLGPPEGGLPALVFGVPRLGIRPNHQVAAMILEARGDLDGAEAHLRAAVAEHPAPGSDARFILACSILRRGRYEEGWRLLEAWRRAIWPPTPYRGRPCWDGRPLGGRAILVRPDWGGLGDDIMMARFVPALAGRGAGRIILEAKPPLARLLRTLRGVSEVITPGGPAAAPPPFAAYTRLPSLPYLLGVTPETIPPAPYLRADPALVGRWRRVVGAAGPGLRVGLTWAAGPTAEPERSLPLAVLASLARVPDARFFALQKGAAEADPAPPEMQLTRLGPSFEDMRDTAAAMLAMDLIVTVDTGPAHLAGALGRPTWVLLPHAADWRWELDPERSPWYPTMRLFRQERPDDWSGVVRDVAAELAALIRIDVRLAEYRRGAGAD